MAKSNPCITFAIGVFLLVIFGMFITQTRNASSTDCGSEGENLYKWCYGAGALGITIGALNIFTAVLDYKTTEENATRLALFRTVLLLMNVTTLTFECGWSIWGIVIAYAHHDELGECDSSLVSTARWASVVMLVSFSLFVCITGIAVCLVIAGIVANIQMRREALARGGTLAATPHTPILGQDANTLPIARPVDEHATAVFVGPK